MYSPTDDPKYQAGDPPTAENPEEDVIISSDTGRANRIPPGQTRTRKWPVLHASTVPSVPVETWSLEIKGLVERPFSLSWTEFLALPRVKVFADFHCVTTWSRLGNLWEGVAAGELAERAGVRPEAKFVSVTGYDNGWTTNLPLNDFLADDVLFADRHDGDPMSADHGGPVRLVVPLLYAWKSAKWVKCIEFVADDLAGYWEQLGYHMRGDPWVVNESHPDGERFRDDAKWNGA